MMLKKFLVVIGIIAIVTMIAFAQTGSYTTHGYFYLPDYGAYGLDEYNEYNTYMEIADNQIQDNKESIEAIEADYLVAADLTDYYTKLEIDAFNYITTAEAVAAIKADVDWNATEWDLAYGWGDHSLEGYLTTVALNDISDVDTTGVANNKILKYDLGTTSWIIADDEDTTYTSSDFTHDDLTGVTANEHIDWTISQSPTVIHSDNYTDTDTDTLIGLTDTPANFDDTKFLKSGTTSATWEALTESDITDLGTYLEDITSENFASLSDIPAHPAADNKILETLAGGTYQWIDTPSGNGGGGATTFTGLTDTPANYTDAAGKFVKVNSTPDGLEFWDGSNIAMTDGNETVSGIWAFTNYSVIGRFHDVPSYSPQLQFHRARDGDPTYIVQTNDVLGELVFYGARSEGMAFGIGASIKAIADGVFATADYPTRIEFATVPDDSSTLTTRMAIDNAGNIKMGDGAWTNYVNISNAGALTLEGTANIEGVNATEFGYLDGVTSDIQTQLNTKIANVVDDTSPKLGGNLDGDNKRLTKTGTVEFNGLYDNGNSGSSITIDWQKGQYQEVTVSANTVISFSNAFVGTITLNLNYGGAYTVDFNAGYTIQTEGGTALSFTETNGAFDVVKIYYYGTTDTYVVGVLADVK